MMDYHYIYGPVPSRRMGLSLGVSPLIEKRCNYSCAYCQLGKTKHMTNSRSEFIPLEKILEEFDHYINNNKDAFDVVTIVGEGEPTLYSRLGELIRNLKKKTDRPVAVITNGALLYEPTIQKELMAADIVLPSLDAYNQASYRKINRPHGTINFDQMLQGLIDFSTIYPGQLWIEIMFVKGMNDSTEAISKFKAILNKIKYNRLFINVPIRPPAENWVECPSDEQIAYAVTTLNGVSIENLLSNGFGSQIKDDYDAVMSIINRHPMNQYEIEAFLKTRNCETIDNLMNRLNNDEKISKIEYKGYITYRIKEY